MRFSGFIGLALLGLLLTGCNTPPDRQVFPDITFENLAPFKLDVAQIEIVQGYHPDPANDIGEQFPEAPMKVVKQWAQDRLQAAGSRGQAIYTIQVVKAIDTPLPRSQGFSAVTHKDQSDRYDLTVTVNLEVNNMSRKAAAITAQSSRSQTVAEDMTLNQREGVLFKLLDDTMKDFNGRMDTLVPQYLGAFLR